MTDTHLWVRTTQKRNGRWFFRILSDVAIAVAVDSRRDLKTSYITRRAARRAGRHFKRGMLATLATLA